MADVTIASQTTELPWDGATPPWLRIFAKVAFHTAAGVPVHAGNQHGGRAYRDVACTLDGSNRVVTPALTLPSTTDSVDLPSTAEYIAFLYSRGADGASQYQEFSTFAGGFKLDHTDTSTTWEDIRAFNQGVIPAASSDRTVNGNLLVTGNLQVNGNVSSDDTLQITDDVNVSGTVTATAFQGNGAALTGITGATGGVANAGSTTVGADTDSNGSGVVSLQTRLLDRLLVNNDGTIDLLGGLAGYARASLPNPGGTGRVLRVTDEGNRIYVDTGYGWTPLTEGLNVQWLGASGARSGSIPTTFTTLSAGPSAGATSISVASSTGFSQYQTIKLTGAGPSGGVWRGIITNISGTTWDIYPPLHTAVSSGASVHPGDNNVKTRTSGAVLAGATTIPVEDCTSFKAGQDIYVAASGAVSGGSRLHEIRTIQSVSAASGPGNIVVTVGITAAVSQHALVMHDDTRAINAGVTILAALGGGKLLFPDGTYMCNGAPTTSQNARIPMPSVSTGCIIKFQGTTRAVPNFPASSLNHAIAAEGTIIQSDAYNGCLIGGINAGNFTAAGFEIEDMTLRGYDNPQFTALNAEWVIFLDMHRVMIDTGSQSGAATQPTLSTSYGLKTPKTANGGSVEIDDVWVIGGWYTGAKLDEHARVGTITSFGNYYGYEFGGNVHPLIVDRLVVHECRTGLNFSAASRFTIHHYVGERRWSGSVLPSWMNTVAEVNDPSNYGAGEIRFSLTEGSSNSYQPFVKVGGLYIRAYPISWPPDAAIGRAFSDTFNDNSTDTHRWAVGSLITNSTGEASGTVTEQNNRLEIAPQAGVAAVRYRGYVTREPIDLMGKRVKVKVSQVASNNAATVLAVGIDHNNCYFVEAAGGGNIYFNKKVNGVYAVIDAAIPYSAVNHLWWSIRETAGVVVAEVSPDGSTWTTLGDDGFEMFLIQAKASLEGGVAASIATPGTAFFDDFSIS